MSPAARQRHREQEKASLAIHAARARRLMERDPGFVYSWVLPRGTTLAILSRRFKDDAELLAILREVCKRRLGTLQIKKLIQSRRAPGPGEFLRYLRTAVLRWRRRYPRWVPADETAALQMLSTEK